MTLLDGVLAYIEAAKELGVADTKHNAADLPTHLREARAEWLHAVRGLLGAVKLVKLPPADTQVLLGSLNDARDKAGRKAATKPVPAPGPNPGPTSATPDPPTNPTLAKK